VKEIEVKKILICIILISVFISSCYQEQPSESYIQTALVMTQAIQESQRNAPVNSIEQSKPQDLPALVVPPSELDIEPLLLQSGDLPSEYERGVVSNEIPSIKLFNYLRSLPTPDFVVTLNIEDKGHQDIKGADVSGNRVVYLAYTDTQDRDRAFNMISTSTELGEKIDRLEDVGEKAVVSTDETNVLGWRYQQVVFTICNTVVYMSTTADTINYANRLERRLASTCQ
jgi:hypothetical protein